MVPERDAMKTLGAAAAFFASRDVILKHRTDYASAVREFTWPAHEHFNWALDYFDTIAAGNHRPALHILEEDGTLPKTIMPDALHPNEKGYEIWAESIRPTLDELMKS